MPALLFALAFLVAGSAIPVELALQSRTIVVRGTVRDASSLPVADARITAIVAGKRVGSGISGQDGRYSIRSVVDEGTTQLVLSVMRIGYQRSQQTLTIARDTIDADVILSPAAAALAGVVVTSLDAARSRTNVGSKVAARGGFAANAPIGFARAERDPRWNTEEYAHIEDNKFVAVGSSPFSTFSVDVDRASYTNVRRFIREGQLPQKDAVRVEELINYFTYDYAPPSAGSPISITTDVTAAPWNSRHRIVRIGLQTRKIETAKLPPSNLVFLLDVSGSMMPANKLPLVKQAFRLLVNELREDDRVAIVVYAGNAGLVLPSTPASDKATILDAIERLEAGGSTAGGAGIRLAYDVAKQNHMPEGNNRVIWATDGDFNIGISSTSELVRFVEEKRAQGTALTILGFGMGNLKDARMEQLADKGDGNYAYIDHLLEAKKVFVQEMGATLLTVAKDVKLQVEFNPATVQAYRLIGYENRLLRNEDFTDDRKDAGEMGAGHSVTALYEIVPVGVKLDVVVGTTPPKRYQNVAQQNSRARTDELLFVNVRYKPPTDTVSRLLQHAVVDSRKEAPADLRFALAVAGYGMILRDSPHRGALKYEDVLALARGALGPDEEGYRRDFVSLVESTMRIASNRADAR